MLDKVPFLPVTDQMRKSVLFEGQPLFERKRQFGENTPEEIEDKIRSLKNILSGGTDNPDIIKENILQFVKNHNAGKELGLYEGVTDRLRESKLKHIYDELLAAPAWFFDKHPKLAKIWNVIDKEFVRDINEDLAELVEDYWRKGEPFRKLSKAGKQKVLNAFDKYINDLYDMKKYRGYSARLTYDQFISRYGLTGEEASFINIVYKPMREKLLNLLEQKDFYLLVNTNINQNPFLEGLENVRGSNKRVEFIEDAKQQFFAADPSAREIFENELAKLPKANDVEALNNAWASDVTLREHIAADLADEKYSSWRDKVEIPTSRMNDKYFIAAYKPIDDVEAVIYGIKIAGDKFFASAKNESDLLKIKESLINKGFEEEHITVGRFDKLRENILDNAVTEEDVIDLFNNSNLDLNSEIAQKLLKNIKSKGFTRHFIPKQYVPGFEFTQENFEKTIYRHISGMVNYVHKIIGLDKLQRIMSELKKNNILEDGSNEEKYIKDLYSQLNVSDVDYLKAVRMVASTLYLTLKPSYIFQQAIQPFKTLLPYVPVVEKELGLSSGSGELAFGDAIANVHPIYLAKILNKMGDVFADKNWQIKLGLDEEFLKIVKKMERQGVAKPLRSMELLGEQVDPKRHYRTGLFSGYNIGKFKVWVQPFIKLINIPSILVEDFTRIIGVRTFYLMGKKAGLSGEKLEQFISTNIAKTYGPASGRQSRPPGYNLMGGLGAKNENFTTKLARSMLNSVTIFKNFGFMNYGQWGGVWREMRKNRNIRGLFYKTAGSLATTGILMMMWVTTAMALLRWIYSWFNRAKDPEEDLEKGLQVADKLLPGASEILLKGLAYHLGYDLSNLLSEQAPFITEDIAYKNNIGEVLGGVPYAVAKDVGKAINEGDLMNIVPTGVRNWRKAAEMKEKGINWNAKTLIKPSEIDATDVVAKRMGFMTKKISSAYDKETRREFRAEQISDEIRDRVKSKIVPLIESNKYEEAKKELNALYLETKNSDTFTDRQKKSISGLSSFVTQYVLPRLKYEDTHDIMEEFRDGMFKKRRARNLRRVRAR